MTAVQNRTELAEQWPAPAEPQMVGDDPFFDAPSGFEDTPEGTVLRYRDVSIGFLGRIKQKVRATHWGESAVVRRRSFMSGFAASIGARLAEAEKTVEESDGEYGLVLVDDFQKATEARDNFAAEQGFLLGNYASKRSFDADAFSQGHAAGQRSDIGQTRVGARPALPF